MRSDHRRRPGFALLTALLVMLCLGALLSVVAFTAREDHALSVATRDARRAFATAEMTAWSALNAFDSSHLGLHVGGESHVPAAGSADTAEAVLRRLGVTTFLAVGMGGVRGPRDELLVRRSVLLFTTGRDSLGALTTTLMPGRYWLQP